MDFMILNIGGRRTFPPGVNKKGGKYMDLKVFG